MSGLYIPGLSMPRKTGIVSIVLSGDGSALLCEDGAYSEIKVIPVPDHGDLIDKSGLDVLSWTDGEYGTDFEDGVLFVLDKLDELPVIIPADDKDYELPADKEGEG